MDVVARDCRAVRALTLPRPGRAGTPRRRALVWVTALAVAATFTYTARGQPPAFETPETMLFSYPPIGARTAGDVLAFRLVAKGGAIQNVRIRVVELRDPLKQSLDPSLLAVLSPPKGTLATLTATGTEVRLKPDPPAFAAAGEYEAILVIEGEAGGGKEVAPRSVKVTVRRISPALNTEEISGETFQLTRWLPCWTAGGTMRLTLREVSGKAPLTGLKVVAGAVFRAQSKVQVAGAVKASSAPAEIPAGDEAVIELTLNDIAEPGTLSTDLTVFEPTLGTKVVPIKLLVTDPWYCALVAIAVGVLGAFGTYRFAETYRPQKLNQSILIRLWGELRALRPRAELDSKIEALNAISKALREAGDANRFGQVDTAQALFKQARQDLQAFHKAEAADRDRVRADLADLRARERLYQQRRGRAPTQPEVTFFEAFDARSAAVENFLTELRADTAARALGKLKAEFDQLRAAALDADLTALEAKVAALAPNDPAKVQEFQTDLKQARSLLAEGKLDEAASKADSVRAAAMRLRPRGARPEEEGEDQTGAGGGVAAPPAGPRIAATDPAGSRSTDGPLSFQLDAPAALLTAADTFEWDFGDGTGTKSGGRQETHRFDRPGDYLVKLQIRRGPQRELVAAPSVTVTVLPGRDDLDIDRLACEIFWGDALVSAIALVLACFSGLLAIYYGGQTFGSIPQYIAAVFWGFGLDNSVRGFSGVLKKVTTSDGMR